MQSCAFVILFIGSLKSGFVQDIFFFKMASKGMDEYRVIETINNGQFGLRQKVIRVSDRHLFEWREINYKSMDDALKEVRLTSLFPCFYF